MAVNLNDTQSSAEESDGVMQQMSKRRCKNRRLSGNVNGTLSSAEGVNSGVQQQRSKRPLKDRGLAANVNGTQLSNER